MVLGDSWMKLMSPKLSHRLKVGRYKGQSLNDLVCQEVLLLGCGDVTRRRASLLHYTTRARSSTHDVRQERSLSSKLNTEKSTVYGQKATNRVPACNL